MPQLIIWKVGTDDRPASQQDIDDLNLQLREVYNQIAEGDESVSIVTHHAVTVEKVDLYFRGHSIITANQNDVIVFSKGEVRVVKKQ